MLELWNDGYLSISSRVVFVREKGITRVFMPCMYCGIRRGVFLSGMSGKERMV